jgi:DNA-binding SARP family transcriptional activator
MFRSMMNCGMCCSFVDECQDVMVDRGHVHWRGRPPMPHYRRRTRFRTRPGALITSVLRTGGVTRLQEMLHVRLIGPPAITSSTGEAREVRGQKPWTVLARLLVADRPLTRRELSTELFSDAEDPLGSLRWCLAGLRKALGSSDLLTGDPVCPDLPAWITVDVLALADGIVDAAAAGEFLEGIDTPCGPEFSMWLLVTRQQVAARVDTLLREQAITALGAGDTDTAIRLAQRCVQRAPFDESGHVLLVKSLMAAGHNQAALAHIHATEESFRHELDSEPSPALRSAARQHVADPPPGVPPAAVASTLIESGRAALAAGAVDAGVDCLRHAGAQAEAAGDDALLGRCLYELGTALVHAVRGFDDEGAILLEQAVQLARGAGDIATAVSALRERGYADALAGRRPEAERHLSAALDLADGDTRLLAGIHAIAGFNLCDWGRYEQGFERYEEALDASRSTGERRREAWTLGLGGWALLLAGRASDAIAWLNDSLALADELHWRAFEPWPLAALAEVHLAALHEAPDGPSELERCFAMSCQLDDPCWEGASGRVLALYHARRGDNASALRWIEEARSRCVRKTDIWAGMLGTILLTDAELRFEAGDLPGADAAARDLVAFAARTHLDALLPRGVAILSERPTDSPSGAFG